MEKFPRVSEHLSRWGLEYGGEELSEGLFRYAELLSEWNRKFNLTAITEEEEVEVKHFADSLSLLNVSEIPEGAKLLDIGSGAGFPGIPVKLARPDLDIVLLDSLNKRITFLNTVIEELKLQGISAIHGRAEELARKTEFRERFDVVTSRAVARLNLLCEYALPFVRQGGMFVAMKGSEVSAEISEAETAIRLLGGESAKCREIRLTLDGGEEISHHLVVIRKKGKTPTKYPRGGGKPKKNPL